MTFILIREILSAMGGVDLLATLALTIWFSNKYSQLLCFASSFDRINMLCIMTSLDPYSPTGRFFYYIVHLKFFENAKR